MSFFSKKRAGRRISTFDDDEDGGAPLGATSSEERKGDPPSQSTVRFGKRSSKQSSLRRSININDEETRDKKNDDEEETGPAVVRPSVSRSGSLRAKKRASTSRLSFGGIGPGNEDEDTSLAESKPGVSTPKKPGAAPLSQRVLESNAFRRSLTGRLPTRAREADDDEDRPRYSKEYLADLQSSTPNTPRPAANAANGSDNNNNNSGANDGDAMELDPSELEGAVVVDPSELAPYSSAIPPASVAHVLTETEIRERKERRARLALEKEVITLGSDDDEENGYISLGATNKKKEKESRLVREDEDLGEGYEEFVDDERLSLSRKAEKEARKKRKKEMAELIDAAEYNGDDGDEVSEDDSEAERQAAYNAAQTRAGMDGLHRPGDGLEDRDDSNLGPGAIPRMKPLPLLADCLARMQSTLDALKQERVQRDARLAALEQEKAEILAREVEVQEILDKAGKKYQAVLGKKPDMVATIAATHSPLRALPPGLAADLPVERGLESIGTTPTRRADADDVF